MFFNLFRKKRKIKNNFPRHSVTGERIIYNKSMSKWKWKYPQGRTKNWHNWPPD